jgi:hypothetical protein
MSPMLLKRRLRFNSSPVTVTLVMAYVALAQVFPLFVQLPPLQSPCHLPLQLCTDTRLAQALRCVRSDNQRFISQVNQHQGQ